MNARAAAYDDALNAAIDRAFATLATAGNGSWALPFIRSWVLAERFEHHGRNAAHLDSALAEFLRLPAGTPGRADLAAALVHTHMRSGVLSSPAHFERVESLATVVDAAASRPEGWTADRAVVRVLWLMTAMEQGRAGADPRSVLAELDHVAGQVPPDHAYAVVMESARLGALHMRARLDGDNTGMADVTARIRDFRDRLPPGSQQAVVAELMEAMQVAAIAREHGDPVTVEAELERIGELRQRLDGAASAALGTQLDEAVQALRVLRPAADGDGELSAETLEQMRSYVAGLRVSAGRPDVSAADRAGYLVQMGVVQGRMGPEHIDAAVADLRAAVELAPPADQRFTFVLMSFGLALVHRFELRRGPKDLLDGIRALERARVHARDPASPHWAAVCQILGLAYRHAGRRALGGETARDGLRGHAWSVLLQSRTGEATTAARDSASDAVDVARGCLEDDDPAGAALALDAGRGLVLQAATQIGGVVERLTALDEPGLAQRWQRAVAEAGSVENVDVDLRREVIRRLGGLSPGPTGRRPGARTAIGPPDHDEVRAALTALGADALVYLLTAERGLGGAIVVPARGAPTWLRLPRLVVLPGGEPDRYLEAAGLRDAAPAGRSRAASAVDGDEPVARDHLGELCDWAWTAAIGPLLDHVAGGGEQRADRPLPRLVLVPMGELGRVPWHAARSHGRGRTRYAVERAVFSYAVSAGSLCDSASVGDLPLGRSGLVIADPDTGDPRSDLPGARAEAAAIRRRFYAAARHLGRRPDGSTASGGRGELTEVRRWLDDSSPRAGVMLHAACHGVVRAGTDENATSYLQLAGTDRLSAEELLTALTGGGRRALALAVLSACSSAVPGRGYDEAMSLATTFLAGGTRAVVSTQWRISDVASAALMFMFHHYLWTDGLRPADALRAAQLWMIERRSPPDSMPPDLAEGLRAEDPSEIAAWAGFVHFGR